MFKDDGLMDELRNNLTIESHQKSKEKRTGH